jgi:hypothetical protein
MYELEFFEWEDDNLFLDFLDRLGMAGVLSALAGIFFVFGEIDQWTFAWMLTTVILIAVGIQGYAPDYEARWRRLFGGYGSILSFVAFSMEVESETMQALSFVGVGLIALGWGFLTMQRLDDDDGIYEVDENQPQDSIPTPQQASLLDRMQKKAEEVTEDIEDEVEEDIEDEVEEVPEVVEEEFKGIPEPVTSQSEEVPKVVEQVLLPMPDTIETSHGFEIRLPPGKLEAVLKSIDSTPHEGYKPVIGFNSNGQIVIDWVGV